jgi:AcrR family transcriptional regulator
MDDIARHLGISKKTIYQFYQDKDDIVNQVASAHMGQERCDAEDLAREAANPVDEMFRISQMIRKCRKR